MAIASADTAKAKMTACTMIMGVTTDRLYLSPQLSITGTVAMAEM